MNRTLTNYKIDMVVDHAANGGAGSAHMTLIDYETNRNKVFVQPSAEGYWLSYLYLISAAPTVTELLTPVVAEGVDISLETARYFYARMKEIPFQIVDYRVVLSDEDEVLFLISRPAKHGAA